MNNSHLRATDGYTFIELLVAITILSFVITPFLGLFTFSFHSIALSGRQTTAINLCRDKMETVKANGYNHVYNYYLNGGNTPEEECCLPENPDFRRTTEVSIITLYEEDSRLPAIDLLQIRITVYWQTRGQEHRQVLESYLALR